MPHVAPSVEVTLCDVSSGKPLAVVLPKTQLVQIAARTALDPHKLELRKSNAVFRLRLVSTEPKGTVVLLKDGQPWPYEISAPGIVTAQFLVKDDIEYHTVSCVIADLYCASIQVVVHVWREYMRGGCVVFAAPKWSKQSVETACKLYKESTPKAAAQRSVFDLIERRLSLGVAKPEPRLAQALQDAAVNLLRVIHGLTKQDLLPDYPEQTSSDLDLDGTLELIRRHPSTLLESSKGPISLHGKRYTPAEIVRADQSSTRLNLSLPLTILEECITTLRGDDILSPLSGLLVSVYNRLALLSSVRGRRITWGEVREWLAMEPSTNLSRLLKHYLVLTIGLCKRQAHRGSREGLGLRGLSDSFRDFDLFEWSAFAAVCLALGAPRDAGVLSRTVVACGTTDVINANRKQGEQYVRTLLPGWRDGSDFPARYVPDTIVHFEKRLAIPVDAKFRVGASLVEPCDTGGIKEIQAYLNEFGVTGALVLVPMIPRSAEQAGSTQAVKVQGAINGREHRVWIIEFCPGLPGFEKKVRAALADLVALADSQRTK